MVDRKIKAEDVAYTLEKLRSDVCAQYDEELEKAGEEKMRDKLLKLRVILHFIDIATSVADEKEEDRCDVIRLKLSQNDALFGYTCFLSSNTQFDYSWNYQRKQWEKYVENLGAITRFLLYFVSIVILLQSRYNEFCTLDFSFANFFRVSFGEKTQIAKTTVLWENLEQIFMVQRGFSVSAIDKQVILLASFCKYEEKTVERFLDSLTNITY